MHQIRYTSLIFVLVVLALVSCEKVNEDFDLDRGYDYFPLEEGRSWTYQVDSIIYDDDGARVDSSTSFVREEIVEEYVDALGDTIFRIERFWRGSDTSQWEIRDVWAAFTSEGQAFRVEENLKFVKFVFPPAVGKRWDGNIFFDESVEITVAGEPLIMYKDWNKYNLLSVDESESIAGKEYQNVATVLLTDDKEQNEIERRYALEKYARGVGLVEKHYIILDRQCDCSNIAWEDSAHSGFILKQTLIEYK